ncbi:MAG: thiol-disulfide isomerase [Terriglobia bacterium]|nr:MAG: thiol-disulfide isomerase [Terriglobia bacterium]
MRIFLVGSALAVAAFAASNAPVSVTFNKDVLPILQKNCQGCHRPGEVAPMSLLTYSEARPWAKAMKVAVVSQKMPPWFADPQYGHFANDKRLSQADINTLTSWVDNGAPEGDAKDKPAPITFQSGWNIKPDMVIEMPKPFQLPASGTIDYQYVLVKGNFTEDLWVTQAEMRPGNPKVLHHGKVWVRPPGSHWMEHAVPGDAYSAGMGRNSVSEGNDILGKFNPGLGAQSFEIGDSAKFVPKGSDLVFELHYTAVGEATTDQSKLGLVFAKNEPKTRYFLSAGPTALNLVIPPGDGNAEVVSEVTVGADGVKLAYAQPHMHLRGKDFELRAIYPTGESETVFKGKFDFEWQLGYTFEKPISLPKGTRLIGISHFDNSLTNKYNPDPQKEVHWGPQNWDEMSNCFVGLVFDVNTNPDRVFRASGPSLLPRGKLGPTLAALELK